MKIATGIKIFLAVGALAAVAYLVWPSWPGSKWTRSEIEMHADLKTICSALELSCAVTNGDRSLAPYKSGDGSYRNLAAKVSLVDHGAAERYNRDLRLIENSRWVYQVPPGVVGNTWDSLPGDSVIVTATPKDPGTISPYAGIRRSALMQWAIDRGRN